MNSNWMQIKSFAERCRPFYTASLLEEKSALKSERVSWHWNVRWLKSTKRCLLCKSRNCCIMLIEYVHYKWSILINHIYMSYDIHLQKSRLHSKVAKWNPTWRSTRIVSILLYTKSVFRIWPFNLVWWKCKFEDVDCCAHIVSNFFC